MKKITLSGLLIALGFLISAPTFAQSIKSSTLKKAKAISGGQTASFLNYSPTIPAEEIEGERCLSDIITDDWVRKAGIEESYQMEKEYQNNMVALMDGEDRAVYTIPVIFHVVYNTPAENLSEAEINDLIDGVNEDFSASNPDVGEARGAYGFDPYNVDIEFCMAKQDEVGVPLDEYGIHRVETVETWFNPGTETNKMKSSVDGGTGTEPWDRDRYLNIWICDITNGAGSGIAGYAYKPTVMSLPPSAIDGIVIDYNLGTNPATHVLSHEIGHFLGLDHPWGGGDGSCGTDDGLGDTPNTAGPSFDFGGSCSGDQETCPGTQTQYENFMDYSSCQCMFTEDQSDLMHLVCDNSRNELTTSDVCDTPFPMPPVADFEADITTVIEGGSVNFTDLSTNYPTSWEWNVTPATGVSYIGATDEFSENPVIQFDDAGFFTVELTASNGEGSDTETKTSYIEVIAGGDGTTDCDTSRNYTADEYDNLAFYLVTDEAGYYPSQLTLDDGGLRVEGYAEAFNAPAPTFVKRFYIPIFQADDIAGASDVTFRVWDDAAGEPGAVLGTEVVAISDLNAGFWNTIEFAAPVPVSGNYWAGVEYDYSAGFDTVLFATTNFGDRPSGPSTTSTFISGGIGWTLTSDLFVSEPDCSLIWDVLTSNGPAPTAVASWPEDETCEGMEVTMNGFGSINTTDYYWDIFDGADYYFYDEANLTTSFDEGTWEITLIADGSCESDESETFTLTVNPALDVTTNITDENCTAEDGEIEFVVTGGDGGAYEYSINEGASFFPTSTFTGLGAATYNYVVIDGANCEATGEAEVGNNNDFSPTISPDITITAGTSTDLTVTGGTSWSWYDDEAIYVGETATVTVSPVVTTTYVCNVTNADGCESTLEVTVFIDDGTGIPGVTLKRSFALYPNPSNGSVNLQFQLNEAKDIQVEVVNALGDILWMNQYNEVTDQLISFDLDRVSKGIYFVILKAEGETVSKKLVIK